MATMVRWCPLYSQNGTGKPTQTWFQWFLISSPVSLSKTPRSNVPRNVVKPCKPKNKRTNNPSYRFTIGCTSICGRVQWPRNGLVNGMVCYWLFLGLPHCDSSTLSRNPMKNPFNQRICIKLFQWIFAFCICNIYIYICTLILKFKKQHRYFVCIVGL